MTETHSRFLKLVKAILVEEMCWTPEHAAGLISKHTQVMMNGMMGGMDYRATAIALDMKEMEHAKNH